MPLYHISFIISFGNFKKIWGILSFKTKDTKKTKTEEKEESEDGVQAPEETGNSVGKPYSEEGGSEGPSLPLGLTGNFQVDLKNVMSLWVIGLKGSVVT